MVASSYIVIIPLRKKATHSQLPPWTCRTETSNLHLPGDYDTEATMSCSGCRNIRHLQGLLWKFYHSAAKQRIQSSLKIIMNREKEGMRKAARWPCHLLVRALGCDGGDLASGIIFLFCTKPWLHMVADTYFSKEPSPFSECSVSFVAAYPVWNCHNCLGGS